MTSLPDWQACPCRSKEADNDWQEEKVMVHLNGEVLYVPIRTFNIRCDMDLSSFPYDTQTCNLTLGSWVHSTDEVSLCISHDIMATSS